MTSPGLTRSSPDSRPTADRSEINNRDLSRLTQETPPMIRTLGPKFVHFFLLQQDGEVTLSSTPA
jgi:hypothetical protein